ncbi:hypothetical protein HQ487_01615 [Candidatus Uhrbacteria bacterium]|nr:hypothetical protein [Candidatus Uhrbacteria bacterium]
MDRLFSRNEADRPKKSTEDEALPTLIPEDEPSLETLIPDNEDNIPTLTPDQYQVVPKPNSPSSDDLNLYGGRFHNSSRYEARPRQTTETEKDPIIQMGLKKAIIKAMLQKLMPDQPWNEREISLAMNTAETMLLPKLDKKDRSKLQEIADAIALRTQQDQMKGKSEKGIAA